MKNDTNTTVEELKMRIREFVSERKWEKYHNPKDLAESICIEAAELLEKFQWVSGREARRWKHEPSRINSITEEIADVVIYCLGFAVAMDIDLAEAVLKKLRQNERKYPVSKYRGRARA